MTQRTLVSPVPVGRDDHLTLAARRLAGVRTDGRRTEIAAWTTAIPVLHSRLHGGDREE